MGRTTDYQAAGKTITGGVAQTVTFTSSDVEGAGVIAYHLAMTGANNLSMIDRIRVKANGMPFYDISTNLYRAYVQRFTRGAFHYPTTAQPPTPSTAGTVQNWRRFTIPFCFLDREKSEESDVCQFPVGALPTIEVVFNATSVAGTLFCAWTQNGDITPLCYPKLYSSQMNIALGVVNARYPFSEDGVIRGFGVETTGLGRFRSVINGRQVYHAQGQPVDSATFTEDMLFLETEHLFGGAQYSMTGAITNALDTTIVDPAWIKITSGDEGAPGNTFVELTTTAAWSGPTSELGIYAVVPYKAQAKAA